jgi:hypothetical protein
MVFRTSPSLAAFMPDGFPSGRFEGHISGWEGEYHLRPPLVMERGREIPTLPLTVKPSSGNDTSEIHYTEGRGEKVDLRQVWSLA